MRSRSIPKGIAAFLAILSLTCVLAASQAGAATGPSPPETTITFGPEGWTNLTRPVYGYQSDNPDAWFECRLDSGPFEPCGPATYEVLEGHPGEKLSESTHTIEVRAMAPDGTVDPTPAQAVIFDRAGNATEDRVEFSVRTKPGSPPIPPDPYRNSVLYTGRGKGIKSVSFRLRGQKLIEARMVLVESCTETGRGHPRRHRWRAELEAASPRWPLRVNDRGRFRAFTSEVWPSSDEFEELVGKVTPRSIVGGIARNSSESAPESGISGSCHTGPFDGPMRELRFHASRQGALFRRDAALG